MSSHARNNRRRLQAGPRCIDKLSKSFPTGPCPAHRLSTGSAARARAVKACIFAMIGDTGLSICRQLLQTFSEDQGDARWLKNDTNRLRHI